MESRENALILNISKFTKPIVINKPFIFNESVGTLAGLMPDGSLIKDLMRIYFHQKKDLTKIELFEKLIKEIFHFQQKIFRRVDHRGSTTIYINSKTLSWFFIMSLKYLNLTRA